MLRTRLGARRAQFWGGPGLSWGPLRRHLAGFWVLLGGFWAPLGTSCVVLGRLLGALGCLLPGSCYPRRAWARFGVDLGASWALPGVLLERFLAGFFQTYHIYMSKFGHVFCEQKLHLPKALINAENPRMLSQTNILSTSGAAGCAQHMEFSFKMYSLF